MIKKMLLDTSFQESLPLPCADLVLVHFGKVLLIRRTIPPVGLWTLPGGIILKGQFPQDTALARLCADAGIELSPAEKLYGPIVVTYRRGEGRQDVTITYKVCTSTTYSIQLNEDHDMYVWADWDNLPQPIEGATKTQIAWALGRWDDMKEGLPE